MYFGGIAGGETEMEEQIRRGHLDDMVSGGMVQKQLREMGVRFVPAPLPDAAGLYDSGRSDGFLTVPGAALAFQWSTQLPFEAQQAIRAAGAKLQARFDDVTDAQDAALLGELFARQGLVFTPADRFRAEFFGAAAEAAQRLGAQLVPPTLLQQATVLLAERRAK